MILSHQIRSSEANRGRCLMIILKTMKWSLSYFNARRDACWIALRGK